MTRKFQSKLGVVQASTGYNIKAWEGQHMYVAVNADFKQPAIDTEMSVEESSIAFDYTPSPKFETTTVRVGGNRLFWMLKRGFDIIVSLVLLPVVAVLAIIVFFINLFWNQGSLFYSQTRMGKNCMPFQVIKFRTMRAGKQMDRGPEDRIEQDRITKFGRILRKTRIDELPQILHVLKGDMSFIGPRPDYFPHAEHFMEIISGYKERHIIRPGISGLAQVTLGYAEGADATRKKISADHDYIQSAGFSQEAMILWKTMVSIAKQAGK